MVHKQAGHRMLHKVEKYLKHWLMISSDLICRADVSIWARALRAAVAKCSLTKRERHIAPRRGTYAN
eukprot:6378247-Amphidinium_carterae.1